MTTKEDVERAISDSFYNYGAALSSADGVRGVMNTKYEKPKVPAGVTNWLDIKDDGIKGMVDFWATTIAAWRLRYGSIEGYSTFTKYYDGSGFDGPDWAANVTVQEAYLGSEFQSLRDKFGFASEFSLEVLSPREIANGRTTYDDFAVSRQPYAEADKVLKQLKKERQEESPFNE